MPVDSMAEMGVLCICSKPLDRGDNPDRTREDQTALHAR
jgi:hypothetical protein